MDVIGLVRAEVSPAERAVLLARQAEERADRQAARDEAERQARAEDEHEARLLAARQIGLAGRTADEVIRAAMAAGDEDAEYEACRATMAKIERRRESRQAAVRFEAEQAEALSRASSTGVPGLDHANQLAARLRVEQMLARPKARPPFSRGGVAVRSDVTCKDCRSVGASPEESFMIHSDPSPAAVPADWVAPTEYCRTCYGELPGECKCGTVAGRNKPGRNVAYNRHPAVAAEAAAYESEDRRGWEDERSLRVAHGGGDRLAVRDGGYVLGVR